MPEGSESAVDAGPPTQPSLDARPDPFEPLPGQPQPAPQRRSVDGHPPTEPFPPVIQGPDLAPVPVAEPVEVPSQFHFLKRWTFVLVLLGVWVPAAAAGVGLYHLWFTSVDKTLAMFLLLVFLLVCTVLGMLLSMVEGKPLVSAVALALLSAPGAATAAAAVLHGAYYFQWIERPR